MSLVLRPYHNDDLDAALLVWQRAWEAAMPGIDFSVRLAWWWKRWTDELVPRNAIVVAESNGKLAGFVVIDPKSGYLDQIVVRPEDWGTGIAKTLLDEAKRFAAWITLEVNQSNLLAIRFYEREDFRRTGEGVNPRSGLPTFVYCWTAD